MGTGPYIDFQHVRERADILAIAAFYNLKLFGRGAQRKAHCPFHDDRRPSLSLELDKRVFHCFGCGRKGNALEFVADLEKLDRKTQLREASIKLADICGISLAPGGRGKGARRPQEARETPVTGETSSRAPNRAQRPAQAPGEAPETVNPPLTFALKLDPEHPYLKERKLSRETIDAFGLGYASRGLMKGRLAIPIHDERGALVAYAGRWAGPEAEIPEGEDKYKLPPGFQKHRVLFGLNRIAHVNPYSGALEGPAHLFLVEGYFSVFRLHERGVPSVAALMGSSVSDEQVELLRRWRGLERITLLLDGDDPGRKARESALLKLCAWFYVRAPELPDGLAPHDLSDEEVIAIVDDALL